MITSVACSSICKFGCHRVYSGMHTCKTNTHTHTHTSRISQPKKRIFKAQSKEHTCARNSCKSRQFQPANGDWYRSPDGAYYQIGQYSGTLTAHEGVPYFGNHIAHHDLAASVCGASWNLYVCVCVCVYVCMYVCVCVHVCMYVCMYVCM